MPRDRGSLTKKIRKALGYTYNYIIQTPNKILEIGIRL